jgi:hypothetical protein
MDAEIVSEVSCFFKKLDDGQSPKQEDCAVWSILCTCDILAMQAFVWLCTVRFRAIWLGVFWFGASYMSLR